MAWKEIGSILSETFSRFSRKAHERALFADILSKELGVGVKKEDLNIKGNVLHVSAHPAVKNEIFLKKENLLNKLQKQSGVVFGDIK